MTRSTLLMTGITLVLLASSQPARAELNLSSGMDASGVMFQPDLYSPYRPLNTPMTSQQYTSFPLPEDAADAARPFGIEYDPDNDLLVVHEQFNNRVLGYDVSNGFNDPVLLFVIGQPNLTSTGLNTQNPSQGCTTAINACGFNLVQDADLFTLNGTRYLAVGDGENHRVLFFNLSDGVTNGEAAVHVLGQPDMQTGVLRNQCGGGGTLPGTTTDPCGLHRPWGFEFDPTFKTFMVGGDFDRIGFYDFSGGIVDGMPASKVLGQPDLYTNGQEHRPCGGPTGAHSPDACGVSGAGVLLWDAPSGHLFVNSFGRIMVWNYAPGANLISAVVNGAPADWIMGEPGFTTAVRDVGGGYGLTASNGLAIDHAGNRMFVTDSLACRVLVYDISGGAETAAFNAPPAFVLGFPDALAGGFTTAPYNACGRAYIDTSVTPAAYTVFEQIATPSTFGNIVDSVIYDEARDLLLVSERLNSRVMIFGTTIGGVPVSTTGGTSGSSLNPDGSVTVSAAAGSSDFEVTFPEGTEATTSGGSIGLTISAGPGGTHPSVIVSAALPAGTTKSVSMPYVNRDLCINDVPNASITTQTSCTGVKVRRANIPAPGNCMVWEESDTLCRSADGTAVTVNGLENTALYYVVDDDGDGYDDAEDLCPGTNLSGPVPLASLRPNHFGDEDVFLGGCNCSQILECKPGADNGEKKFGCTAGTISVWESGEGWAAACQ